MSDSTEIGEGATFKGHNKNGDYEWSAETYPGKLEGRCEQLRAACEATLANLELALEG